MKPWRAFSGSEHRPGCDSHHDPRRYSTKTPTVCSSMRSADRRRFGHRQQNRRIAFKSSPNTLARKRNFNALGKTRYPIATPLRCAIPAADIQIPIGTAASASSVAASRGFLLRGLSNACPPALTRAARSSREGRHRTNLNVMRHTTVGAIANYQLSTRKERLNCMARSWLASPHTWQT